MIQILTDSAADFLPQELAAQEIACVPMTINFGPDSYVDGEALSKEQFYDLLKQGTYFPTTSQPAPFDFETHFRAAKDARDSIVAVLISSALSGTFQGACMAQASVDWEEIYLVDSRQATAGQRLLVDYAVRLREQGLSARAIAQALEEVKPRIRLYASVDTLEYLYRGGRLSKTAASLGTLAHVKPIVSINQAGEVAVAAKCIGRKRAMDYLLEQIKQAQRDPTFPVYTLYSHDRANRDLLASQLEQLGISVEERFCCNIGPTIGTHVGVGACGLVYVEQ